jgi:hypothetical protein
LLFVTFLARRVRRRLVAPRTRFMTAKAFRRIGGDVFFPLVIQIEVPPLSGRLDVFIHRRRTSAPLAAASPRLISATPRLIATAATSSAAARPPGIAFGIFRALIAGLVARA